MFISLYLIGSSSIVHLVMFLCIPVWKCLHVCSCTCASHAWVCLSAKHRTCCWQAIHSLDSPFWSCSSGGAKSGACHPNHQLLTHPPNSLSSAEQPSLCSPCSPFPGPQNLGCGLWMSATSWLSAQGLAGDWPVVEVQYQALSVSSSFDFLPPLGTGRRQWHKHTLSCDWLGSQAWKWKHHPQNRHIHSPANEKGAV